jgi:hypothetical protein
MPGLIRGVARTAVIAGTATAVSGRVARRQQGRWAAQEQQQYEQEYAQQPPPAPAPAAAPTTDLYSALAELGQLKDSGILTQEEFDAQKAKLLNS